MIIPPTDRSSSSLPADASSSLDGRRIFLIGMYYAPETTGSAPYTSDVAEHLARLGAEVHVVTAKPHYPQWQKATGYRKGWTTEERSGVHVHRLPCYVPRTPTLLKRLVYELSFVAASVPKLVVKRPDLVIGTTPNLFSALLASFCSRLWRRPLVQMVQDVVSEAAHETAQVGRAGYAVRALRRLEGAALRAADVVTVPTEAFNPALFDLGVSPDALVTVKNWSRIAPIASSDSEAMRRRYGWASDFVILHTGNIGVKQGLDELVETIGPVLDADRTVRLVVMGDGNRRRFLEAVTRNRPGVDVVDGVAQDEYPLVLGAADVLLVHEARTVRNMSLPSKLTSYFSAAKPVLAVGSRGGATDLELQSSGAGIFVENDDRTKLASAVRQLQGDAEQRSRLGRSGLRYRNDVLRPSAGLEKIEQVLRVLVSPERSDHVAVDQVATQ